MADAPETAIAARGRVEVALFACAMRRELRANHYKGGWCKLPRRKHFYELDYHLAKLKAAVCEGEPVRILEFAADLANHAMFMADEEGALTEETFKKRESEPSFVKPRLGVYLRLMRNYRWFRKGLAGWRHRCDYESHPESGAQDL